MRLIDADAINPMRCPQSIEEMRRWIDEQPTIEPKPKTGRWIYHADWEEDGECPYECDQCGRCDEYNANYCHFCGAKMEVNHETVQNHP